MAFEFFDLKGFLFVVLLSIPLTSSANIDCGGKPFHCLNSTHFMICVDLGGGLSTTIDDFVIPCPPTTMCQKGNRFECEFPKIEETTTTTVSSLTEEYTATKLPRLEVTSSFNNEILESLREEFARGNEKFFEGDTITSTTTVSSRLIDEIKIKRPKIDELIFTTENYNNFTQKPETFTANAVEATDADVLPTTSTNVPKDNSSIQIDLHVTRDTSINDLYTFNQTKQNSTNESNRTLDVFVKKLERPSSFLHFSVEESPMIDKHSAFNDQLNYVVTLQNSSTPGTLLETISEITINALNYSERVFDTSTNYNDNNNTKFLIESKTKDNNAFIDEDTNQNMSKVINYTLELSTEILKKPGQHENMTSNENLRYVNSATSRPMEITSANLPTTLLNNTGVKKLNKKNIKIKSDMFLNHIPFNNTLAKEGNDINAKPGREMNIKNIFNDDTLIFNVNTTYVDFQNKLPEFGNREEVIANDIAHFVDKPSITEYTTTSDFMPSTNFKQSQTSKLGNIVQTTISNNKHTSVTDSLATKIDEQVFLPEDNFNSNPFIENSTKSSALEDSIAYLSSTKEESLTITSLNHTYVENITMPINNIISTNNGSIEVVETTLSLPATIKDAVQNITPAPLFIAIAGNSSITNGNDLIIVEKESNTTKTELGKNISLTTIGSNNTVPIASNYCQNLTTLRTTNNTNVNTNHVAVSKSPKLTIPQGSYHVDNTVINDTFINYVEDMNVLISEYGTKYGTTKNVSTNTNENTSKNTANVTQLQNSVNEPIFAVQNDTVNLEWFANINLSNHVDKQNETIDRKNQSVDFSTVVSVIKPQRPEYITERIFLTKLSTETPLLSTTISGPKNYVYPKNDILSENSKQDIGNTEASKYTNIPNNIIVSPMLNMLNANVKKVETMGPNIEPPELVHDSILKQATPLPVTHKTDTRNNELQTIFHDNTLALSPLTDATIEKEPENSLNRITSVSMVSNSRYNTADPENYVFSTAYHGTAFHKAVTPRSWIVDKNKNTLSSMNTVSSMNHKSLLGTTRASDSNLVGRSLRSQPIVSNNVSELTSKITLKNEITHNFNSVNDSSSIFETNRGQTTSDNKSGFSKIQTISNLIVYQNRSNDNLEHAIESPHGVSERTTSLNMNYTPTNRINNDLKPASVNTENPGATTNDNKENNTSSPFNCPKLTRGRYADSQDCRKFYTCLGKLQPVLGICPKKTVFSEINKVCTRNLSHCVRNNQFHCLYEGRFSDFLKDNIFYICVKNSTHGFVRYTLRCKNGYHLNKAITKCEKNTETWNESATSSSNSNISNDPNGSVVNSEVSEKIDKSDFECKNEGNFPNTKDCRKYYVCTKNSKDEYRRKIYMCASDEIYDSKKNKCVSSESEEC